MVDELSDFLAHHQSGHFRRTPGWRTERAAPADHLLVWVLDGELVGELGSTPVRAGPGDLVLFPPQVAHRYAPGETGDLSWRWLWVHYGGTAAPVLRERLSPSGAPLVRLGFDERIRTRFLELVTVAATPWPRPGPANLRAGSCLYSLLGLMIDRMDRSVASAPDPTGSADLAAVLSHIDEHLDEPLTLDGLARQAGFSPSHLRRLFQQQLGTSPLHYVTELRLSRAATLLRTSTLSVSAVGRAVGFRDPFHFSRRFKQVTGQAPAHYRAAAER